MKFIGFVLALGVLGYPSLSVAYEVTEVLNGGSISGKITFKGTPPTPRLFEVKKDPEICGSKRALTKVEVNNGFLKGAIIVLEGVRKGKPYQSRHFQGEPPGEGKFLYGAGENLALEIQVKNCNFGPFAGVLAKEDPVPFRNYDSIKHALHTFAVRKRNPNILRTVQNRNIAKNSEIEEIFTEKKFKNSNVVAITCDRHEFMENWMYITETPYFAISDHDGNFSINHIPPGGYKLIAWHPMLGLKKHEVAVKAHEKIDASFEFSKK